MTNMGNYIPGELETSADMRYEKLAIYALDCERWGGPNDMAVANHYNSHFVPEIDKEGTKALNIILDALIHKNQGKVKAELKQLKESLTEVMKQQSGIELINLIYEILKDA